MTTRLGLHRARYARANSSYDMKEKGKGDEKRGEEDKVESDGVDRQGDEHQHGEQKYKYG